MNVRWNIGQQKQHPQTLVYPGHSFGKGSAFLQVMMETFSQWGEGDS